VTPGDQTARMVKVVVAPVRVLRTYTRQGMEVTAWPVAHDELCLLMFEKRVMRIVGDGMMRLRMG